MSETNAYMAILLDTAPTKPVEAVEARERIRKGIEFLDKVKPGWRDEINLPTLNMASHFNCVLGQVYGTLYDGVCDSKLVPDQEQVFILKTSNWKIVCDHGFGIQHGERFADEVRLPNESAFLPSETLTRLWKEELQKGTANDLVVRP